MVLALLLLPTIAGTTLAHAGVAAPTLRPDIVPTPTSEVVIRLEDGWTVVTADGSLSAHFEHTIAVTGDGHEVLTAR